MPVYERILNRSKDILFAGGFSTGWWMGRNAGRLTGICYHRVDDPSRFEFLERGGLPVISPEQLEKELSFLKKSGARFTTFRQLEQQTLRPADPVYMISFDDGYKENYTLGLGVLDRLGIQAVFFQNSDAVGSRELLLEHALFWFLQNHALADDLLAFASKTGADGVPAHFQSAEELVRFLIHECPAEHSLAFVKKVSEHLKQTDAMRRFAETLYPEKRDIEAAHRAGHEIASHGRRHLKRSTVSDDVFEQELAGSSRRLFEITGVRPLAFAYPHGDHRPGDAERVAGHYRYATVVGGAPPALPLRDAYHVPRHYWVKPAPTAARRRRFLLTGAL